MQRSMPELPDLDNLELDPFAEDEKNPARSYTTEGDDDDFEVVAAKLNTRRNDDDPILAMRAMLNDTPYTKREEKNSQKTHSSSSKTKNSFEDLATSDKVGQKINHAQKKIKAQLRNIRNKVKLRYKEMKANERNTLSNTALGEAVKSDQQSFVDYLLCEVAGIPKFSIQFEESKENKQLIMTQQLNKEYMDFKDIHYHKLVVCMVTFLQSYADLGLNYLTVFSGLQFTFRNYLYEKLKPSLPSANITETKQNNEPILIVPIANPKEHVAPPPSLAETPHRPAIADLEEHLGILERLSSILQTIATNLSSCFIHVKRAFCCGFFSRPTQEEDDGLDHKHNDDSKRSPARPPR